MNYTTRAGKLYAGTQEIVLRGINHFGFNTPILQPQFLWLSGWREQIAHIKSLGFNAVRVPFVPATLYNTKTVDQLSFLAGEFTSNNELRGKTPFTVLDMWMAEAERVGLYVLLDFHSVTTQQLYPTWFTEPAHSALSYNGKPYTQANWIRDLVIVAKRYEARTNFIGLDLYNEPNGLVRWGAGDANMTDARYFWKPAAEAAAKAILAANPNLLIFVQGTTANFDGKERSDIPWNFGENFQAQAYAPLQIQPDKLVLSPHTYGPDVWPKSSFTAPNFPANLAADWTVMFGQFSSTFAVVPGEWGGQYGTGKGGLSDRVWQDALVAYMLLQPNMLSNFYWTYTSNSGDTGGILDGAGNVILPKLALIKRLPVTPLPSVPGVPSVRPEIAEIRAHLAAIGPLVDKLA